MWNARARWIWALGLALAPLLAHSQADLDSTPALLAARAWLAHLDAGRYGKSYEDAAPVMRDSVTKVQWETGIERARGSLGVAIARKIRQAACSHGTQADPEAEICTVQYDTQFENRPLGDERVTILRGRDGTWRVGAYQLR